MKLRKIKNTLRGVIVTGIALCFVLPLTAQFGGGEGTEEDPWEISRPAHLNNIRGEFLSGHFIQTAHIDLSPEELQDEDWYNQEEGWMPIGPSSDEEFTGVYDGDGYEIRNLTINRVTNNQSIFGRISGATLKNINSINVDVSGRRSATGLVGMMSDQSLVENCFASGNVSSPPTANEGWHTGGLVGQCRNSTISNSSSAVEVFGGYTRTGGLVGSTSDANIINCHATGSVSNDNNVIGGLVGYASGNSITNSYAIGQVTAPSHTGGLVGFGNITITNSYWDVETTVQQNSAGDGGEGRSTQEMIYPYGGDPRTYAEWDFDEIWVHDEDREVNDGYPYLFFMDGEPPVVLDPPAITVELVIIDDDKHAQLTWQAVEDAASYKVYSTDDLTVEDWGEPVGHTGETSFSEVVDDNRYIFYYVVASVEEAP